MLLALTGARILTASNGAIEHGTLLIEGRTIKAVGADVRPPEDAEVWDVSGKVLIPGMIDAHTHLGLCQDGVGPARATRTRWAIPWFRTSAPWTPSIPRTSPSGTP